MSMMAAYPPGMQQGAGMPHGHPGMGPGAHGQNPGGQTMGQPMQMHPGAAGPGGVHVGQAGPTGGMQPGMGGPGPGPQMPPGMMHNPQMQLLQQHRQMQAALANNPQFAAMQRQQQMQQHQQQFQNQQQQQQQQMMQQQRLLAQQQAHNAQGQNPLLAQQMAALQGHPMAAGGNVPPQVLQHMHNQSMLQKQQAMIQMQQRMAMQQQSSQESHASQQMAQNQPGQQGPQPPMRPPSQMAGRAGPQGAPQGQMPPQQPQPPSQPNEPQQAPGGPAQQQTQPVQQQGPNTPQQPNQGPNQQQQGQGQGPGNQQQQGGQTPQQSMQQMQNQQMQSQQMQNQQSQNPQLPNQQTQQQQQQLQQRMQQMRFAALQQQQNQQAQRGPRGSGGVYLIKLMHFAEQLSKYAASKSGSNELPQWQAFVNRNFSEDGVFRHIMWNALNKKSKQFEIHAPSLARYFYLNYCSGVENMQLVLDISVEKEMANGQHFVVSDRAKIIYNYTNGTQVVSSGELCALFGGERLDLLEFKITEYKEFIPKAALEQLRAEHASKNASPNMRNMKQSPKMQKKVNPRQQNQSRDNPDDVFLPFSKIPQAPINDWGVTAPVMRYLEVGEIMVYMRELFQYSLNHPEVPPGEAMDRLVSSYESQGASGMNPNLNQPGQPGMTPHNGGPPMAGGQPRLQGTPQMPNQVMQGHMGTPQQLALQAQQQGPGSQFSSPAGGPHMTLPPGHPGAMGMGINMPNGSPAMQHMMGTPQMTPGGLGGSVNSSPAMSGTMQPPGMGIGTSSSPNPNNKRRRSTVKLEGDVANGDQKVKESPRVGGKRQKGAPG